MTRAEKLQLAADLDDILTEFWPDDERSVELAIECILRRVTAHDEGETPCVSCHRVGVHALNCPNRSVPVEGTE